MIMVVIVVALTFLVLRLKQSVPILSITDNKNMVVNGNVGIGTTSPNYLGNNEPTPNSTNFPYLSKPSSGATAPIKLDVRGSIELSSEDQEIIIQMLVLMLLIYISLLIMLVK